jgi:hypothetical protein
MLTLEDVAKGYLNQLIHRSLVQVVKFLILLTKLELVESITIHMLLEVILSKSEELDFHLVSIQNCLSFGHMLHEVILSKSKKLDFHLVSIQTCLSFGRIAQRLSIQNNVNS